jgi:hypothetical protein
LFLFHKNRNAFRDGKNLVAQLEVNNAWSIGSHEARNASRKGKKNGLSPNFKREM